MLEVTRELPNICLYFRYPKMAATLTLLMRTLSLSDPNVTSFTSDLGDYCHDLQVIDLHALVDILILTMGKCIGKNLNCTALKSVPCPAPRGPQMIHRRGDIPRLPL